MKITFYDKNIIENDFVLLTIATHKNRWFNDWEYTAKKWGYNYKILGLGQKWEGFQTKINLIIDYSKRCRQDRLLCIVDSYDLVIAGPPLELISKYYATERKIVVGTEDICGPNCHITGIPVKNTRKPYINGGFVMGRACDIHILYKNVFELCSYDDQVGISRYAEKYPEMFDLDSTQNIILNINHSSDVKDIEKLLNGRFKYKPTGSTPVIVHTPFMQKDLGTRSNFVRKHSIKDYKSISTLNFLMEFLGHLSKHMWNPVYFKLTVTVVTILIILLLLFMYTLYRFYKKYS